MNHLKHVRPVFLLFMLLLFFNAAHPRLTLAAGNEDLVAAEELADISGAQALDIINSKNTRGNWKEANQYIFEQFTMNHSFEITQQTLDDLKLKGYKFQGIIQAARIAAAFRSTPEAILKLKPQGMDWNRFGGLMQQYKLFRRIFRRIDANPGSFSRAKEEILAAEVLGDSSAGSSLHNTVFSGEELLGIMLLADLNGISGEKLLSELRQANLSAKETIINALKEYNKAVGLGE